jgi:low affinity Fe/Cu permease
MSMTTQAPRQAPSLQNAGPGAFVRFTDAVSRITGSSGATLVAAAAMLVWLMSGPFFHFSDTWQLVVNTGTTVLTFLMVFVIQATQIRDSTAMHVKLDELIAVTSGASDRAIGIERAKEAEIDRMRRDLERRVAALGDQDEPPSDGV